MSLSIMIMSVVLMLTFFSPFAVYYAISKARKQDFNTHRKIQNITFVLCVLGVFVLEGLIRYTGGSGSLAVNSSYFHTSFFKITLFSHIIVAILSYLIWLILIVISNLKFQRSLPGTFSKVHKRMGYVLFIGLIYTAITSVMVYCMTLNLV